MRIAVSNLAWDHGDSPAVAQVLRDAGVRGIEIAPTKIWPEPTNILEEEAVRCRHFWNDHGFEIVAVQSLLFRHPELLVFGDDSTRQRTSEYLKSMIRLAAWLGAQVVIFGSPKNRRAGGNKAHEIEEIAIPFFRALGEEALQHGVRFCIEPNPVAYGCDYINNSPEALQLIKKVNHEGFRLHLDAACMTLSDENPAEAIVAAKDYLCHFHVSEKNLAPVGSGTINHSAFGLALQKIGFSGWRSLEMLIPEAARRLDRIRTSVQFAIDQYVQRG